MGFFKVINYTRKHTIFSTGWEFLPTIDTMEKIISDYGWSKPTDLIIATDRYSVFQYDNKEWFVIYEFSDTENTEDIKEGWRCSWIVDAPQKLQKVM